MPKNVFPMLTAKIDFRFLIYTPKKNIFNKKKHGLKPKNYLYFWYFFFTSAIGIKNCTFLL